MKKRCINSVILIAVVAIIVGIIALAVDHENSGGGSEVAFDSNSLVYVAEVTRHGARAPLDEATGFPVASQ